MGSPKDLNAEQLNKLQALTSDKPEVDRLVRVGKDGKLSWKLPMRSHDVTLVTITPGSK
jgi:xylan 1,4-beta-xylosidase